jgi:small-conductance mechanosensitive channel
LGVVLPQQLLPFLIFGIALAVALVIRHFLVRWVDRKAAGKHEYTSLFLKAIRTPSILWCFIAALEVALHNAPLSREQVRLAELWIGAFLIISVSMALSNMAVRMFAAYGEHKDLPFAVAGLSKTLVNVLILGIGALILMHHFHVNITPILTALGVGGLAVALALQDTLANFFAGIHILVENPIRVADMIKLSSGEEGVVSDIGWRTTRVLTGGHSIIVIPNTKITSGILTNFNIPDKRVLAEVAIFAGLEADPHQVAQLAMDIAFRTEHVMGDPAPVVLFDPGITPAYMQFKLIFHVPNPMLRGGAQSQIRVKLLEAFREHGIPLPDPRRQQF